MSMKSLLKSIISALLVSAMICTSCVTAFAMEEHDVKAAGDTAALENFDGNTDEVVLDRIADESKTAEELNGTVVTLSREEISYVGTVQRPTVTVKTNSGRQLTYKKDFTVDYSDWYSTDAGEYTVTVNYIGDYSGSSDFTYKIVPQTEVTPVLNRTAILHVGTVQRPSVTVTDKYGNQLVYKKDFTVDYSDWESADPGTYTVTVNMIGNYSGSETYEYQILAKSVNLSRTVIPYVGTVQRPTVTIFDANGNQLVYKKDFTVDYSDWYSTDAGEYKVIVNYMGRYHGSEEFTYNIVPQTQVTPKLNRTIIKYVGTVQRPSVTVTDYRGNNLVYKKDFIVDYSDWYSTEDGMYTVTVKMIGNYSGEETYEYYITSNTATLSRTSIPYTATVQRPTVTVVDRNGNPLTYKKDFTVDYSDWESTNVGEYNVTVTYIGDYKGKVTYSYNIVPQTNVTVALSRTVINANGTVQRPAVTVTDYRGNSLVYKKDFTVDYSDWNSRYPGKYSVTVYMQGNYSGTKTYYYQIDDGNSLPLNKKAAQISCDYDNVDKVVFGKSVQGRNLEAFIITPENGRYSKTYVMTFAIHGFEDSYYRDGQLLTEEANNLIEYYAQNPGMLRNFRLVIIPCLNPDGTIAGVNNSRADSTAFGRCTAAHIDMNRDFGSFSAVESRYLRDFLKKYRPDVFTDFHGWDNETIGTPELGNIFNSNMYLSGKKHNKYASTYLYGYVHSTYGCPSVLVEYKSPDTLSHYRTYSAINEVINYYG